MLDVKFVTAEEEEHGRRTDTLRYYIGFAAIFIKQNTDSPIKNNTAT